MFQATYLMTPSESNGQTTVSVSYYTMMHDERNFSNPDKFLPERWIDNEKGNETCNKAAWLPFSYGLRNCVGRPYVSCFLVLIEA